MMRRTLMVLTSVGAGAWILACGCSHYSFSPALRTGPRSVAVPILANETLEYGAEQGVTDAIVAVFTEDNSMRVVPESEADAVVRGRVTLYERPVVSYDAAGNPKEYKVRVVADLVYEDSKTRTTIWEGRVEGWGIYSATGEGGALTTEDEARVAAFERLAQDLLARTVQGW